VKAHEDFLASDMLRGRGSATRDEGIAATYVGARFEGYGLKPAPGLQSFVQTVEVEKRELDGHATLSAPGLARPLQEGRDFYLVSASGESASAPLKKIADAKHGKAAPGSITLVSGGETAGPTVEESFSLAQQGAKVLLVPDSSGMKQIFQHDLGATTRTPMWLKGQAPRWTSLVVLTAAAESQVAGLGEGTQITFTVNKVADEPRFTYNAMGLLPGSGKGEGTLLITAHLDHLGVGNPVDGDSIYNGADDDAAGTTAVLELAHALAAGPQPVRSVLFICFGSEEQGDVGSSYFRDHPPVPLKDIIANIEFEMIGAQDPKMPKGKMMLTGWERSNLGPVLRQHGALLGPDRYPEQHFFQRSDNYALALKGVVAQTVGGWPMPPYYHQPNDDLKHLDIAFMTNAIQSMVGPIRWLANTRFKPAWNPGGQPRAHVE
jgi:aminopeptidase YwaD